MKPPNERSQIKNKALSYLARRDYSQAALHKKLQALGYTADAIELTLQELVAKGLVDDARYCRNYIMKRREKGYGPKRIQLELQMAGIMQDTIAEAGDITDNAWINEARKAFKKRFKTLTQLPGPDFNKQRAKQIRFLQYRGFTQEQINKLLKECYAEED